MQGKLGLIAPGAYADLLVLQGNPFEEISLLHEDRYEMILKEGLIYKDRLTNL